MFIELYRNARPGVEAHVGDFVQLMLDFYEGSEELISNLFSSTGAAMTEPDNTVYTKANHSLKLMAELPAAGCYMYQTAPGTLTERIPSPQVVVAAAVKVRKVKGVVYIILTGFSSLLWRRNQQSKQKQKEKAHALEYRHLLFINISSRMLLRLKSRCARTDVQAYPNRVDRLPTFSHA